MGEIFTNALWIATVWSATPLVLAALGGMFTQQADVLNIALEGMMLIGAFAAISVGAATQSMALALLAAIAAGLIFSLIFGFVSLWLRADFIVVGIGIGILALGLTVLLLSVFYGNQSNFTPTEFPSIWRIPWGPLAHIPVIGPAMDNQTFLVTVTILLVPFCWWVLYRTPYGVRVRAVGQQPEAAIAAGLDPRRIKMSTVLISGVLCGLAGAQFSMANLNAFNNNMTAGAGFIALAAIFVGNVKPLWTALACVLFGFVQALGGQLQQVAGLPAGLMLALPYAVTVIVLLGRPLYRGAVRRRRARQIRAERAAQATMPAGSTS
jgi:simple sugar transport system permease protein